MFVVILDAVSGKLKVLLKNFEPKITFNLNVHLRVTWVLIHIENVYFHSTLKLYLKKTHIGCHIGSFPPNIGIMRVD